MIFTRSYKDAKGHWKSASSFGRDDLLVLAEVCRQAFHWIHRQLQSAGDTGTEEKQPDEGGAAPTQKDDIPF